MQTRFSARTSKPTASANLATSGCKPRKAGIITPKAAQFAAPWLVDEPLCVNQPVGAIISAPKCNKRMAESHTFAIRSPDLDHTSYFCARRKLMQRTQWLTLPSSRPLPPTALPTSRYIFHPVPAALHACRVRSQRRLPAPECSQHRQWSTGGAQW